MDERKVSNVIFEKITNVSELLDIEDIWHELENVAEIYPFNTFEWVLNWWKHFGYGKKMLVLLVYEENMPIGIAPFMITYFEKGLLVKRIKFIGSNNSDYLDFIVRKGHENEFYTSLVNFLERYIDAFTVLDLEHIPEKSEFFPYIMGSNLYYDYDVQDVCPYVELPQSWEEYLNSLDGKFRRNLNYEIRRFFKEYDGSFSMVKDIESIDRAMDNLIVLHQRRWRQRHMPGAFYSKRIREFHKDVAKDMLSKGELSLFELKDGGKTVASLLSYHVGGKRYYYISGYDLDYSKRSVGTITLGLAIKQSIEEGDRIFDFLRGDEEYKKNWTSSKKRNMRFVAARPTMAGKFFCYYIIAENKIIKKIKDRFSG
ncbi:GNAT family N-acetyltransferase [Thermoanaerobacter wiegelii]|uniref:Cellulose biosynthesis protein n=1 Tax=Thermoanaerobacter wiegelii Rt8.B1 TaxID=697303 RepID=G2MSJ8_9THEO|nr:GNAT family N-acetyltransferase [Thermoanaerobacter wiegelii]AEM77775.1 cellulose biosynthesis protein [Thermoanaerobacter wiegelii Rt8.B1]